MKKAFLLLSTLVITTSVQASYEREATYKITIQNLTKGQPLTPPVVISHGKKFNLFTIGEQASKGLYKLAEDGQTDVLLKEVMDSGAKAVVGEGVILPGKKGELILKSTMRGLRLSLAAMLARTNDAFIGLKDLKIKLRRNQSISKLLSVYDAGSEKNTESCAHIPAPPCSSPGMRTVESEGFVRPHEGIFGHTDLLTSRDSFASKAAKLVITRIK